MGSIAFVVVFCVILRFFMSSPLLRYYFLLYCRATLPRPIFSPKYKKLPPIEETVWTAAQGRAKKKENKKDIRWTLEWKLILESLDILGVRQFWSWICSVEDILSEIQARGGACVCVCSWISFLSGGTEFSKTNFEKIREKLKLRNFKAEMSNGKWKPPKKRPFATSGLRVFTPAPLVNQLEIRDKNAFFVRKFIASAGFKGIHKGSGGQNTKTRRYKWPFFGGFSFSIWHLGRGVWDPQFLRKCHFF